MTAAQEAALAMLRGDGWSSTVAEMSGLVLALADERDQLRADLDAAALLLGMAKIHEGSANLALAGALQRERDRGPLTG